MIRPIYRHLLHRAKKNRLLIITPFTEKIKRVTQKTTNIRNEFIAELADDLFIAYASEGGHIDTLEKKYSYSKKISTF